MKRTLLPAALAVALLGSVAFAQAQQQQQPAPDNSTAGTAPAYHHHHRRPNPQREAEFLSKRLNLNSDQTAKLEPIFADRDQKFATLSQDTSLTPDQRHEQMRAIHQGTFQQLQSVLTPDQLQQMQSMRHSRHGQWKGQQGQQPAPTGL